MVCIPCIVVPVILWVFHKFLQPFIIKYWNAWCGKKCLTLQGQMYCADLSEGDKATSEYKYIKERIDQNIVFVFSKRSCNFCAKLKDLFKEIGLSYACDEIEDKANCSSIQDLFEKMTGHRTVPRVFINGKCIGGYSETYTLHNSGELKHLCTQSKPKTA